MTNWILVIGFVAICFQLCIIVLNLIGLRRSLDLVGQVVAIGMQRSGLVRTPEEVAADTEAAEQDDNDIVL